MAYGVHSKKFLCCLPVRLGVFVLSFLQFLLYGFLAFLFWFAAFSKHVDLDKSEKVTAVIEGIHCTIIAIICLCGFYGAIRRNNSLVSSYSQTLQVLFVLSAILSIAWSITWLRKSKQSIIDQCIDGRTDQSVIDACNHVNTIRWVALGWLVFVLLVHLYQCIIVDRYVRQLDEEEGEKWRLKSLKSGVYSEVPGRGSTEALAQPSAPATYPYSDSTNSYGSPSNNV